MESKLTFKQYQNSLQENRFLGLECKNCRVYTIPPQAVCRSCGSQEFIQRQVSNKGIIKTFTVIRIAADGFKPPFIVAMVEMGQGAYLMGNIVGIEPDSANMELIGKKVEIKAKLVKGDLYSKDIWTPVFEMISV